MSDCPLATSAAAECVAAVGPESAEDSATASLSTDALVATVVAASRAEKPVATAVADGKPAEVAADTPAVPAVGMQVAGVASSSFNDIMFSVDFAELVFIRIVSG